jgi:hypothetical protein
MTITPRGMSIQEAYRIYRDGKLLVNRRYQRRCHLDSCVMVWSKSYSAFFVPKAQSESALF